MAVCQIRGRVIQNGTVYWRGGESSWRLKVAWSSVQRLVWGSVGRLQNLYWDESLLGSEGSGDECPEAMVNTRAPLKRKEGWLPSSFPFYSIQTISLLVGATYIGVFLFFSFCGPCAHIHGHTRNFSNLLSGSYSSQFAFRDHDYHS